ncbi:hypothetical protein BTN50_2091 [Candidatus Enterovibrio altilux]|uniref:Mobile element protein n=1 Tax=Candidatus Enterovibrio altilux TaxID=1927128 RepID=A0A291BBU3_9GAMM|nr:hypothetical protein BTN50_2091 [Candidatus Enterovibrio luxaltus]
MRDRNAQINEAYSMTKMLNKLTGLGIPKIKAIVSSLTMLGFAI